MKRIIKALLLFLLILPLAVYGKSYSEGVSIANSLLSSKYPTYEEFLLVGKPYGFVDGKVTSASGFTSGGFLNVEEYIISLPKNNNTSYLAIGEDYYVIQSGYTIAGSSANEKYNNKNIKGLNKGETNASVRVTEYVKPETQVTGSGMIDDPWIFVSTFKLQLEYPEEAVEMFKKDTPTGIMEVSGAECKDGVCVVEIGNYKQACSESICGTNIYITVKNGNMYSSNNCGGVLNEDGSLKINNLIKDTKCTLKFSGGKYKVTIGEDPEGDDKLTSPKEVYLKYGENYYTNDDYREIITDLKSKPSKTGYKFNGYKYGNKTIIDGTGKFVDKTSIDKDVTLKIDNQAINYSITYSLDGGTNNANNPDKYTIENSITLKDPSKSNYTFTGWTGTDINSLTKDVTITRGSIGDRSYTAHWCRKCAAVSNGSCKLNISNTGVCSYETSCNTGYKYKSGANTYNPVCELEAYFSFSYNNKYKVCTGSNYGSCSTKSSGSTTITDPTWKVEFLESGTLTVNSINGNIDIHAVGGGGGGAGSDRNYRAGGGGGGYTKTVKNIVISATTYSVTIGAGGYGGGTNSNGGDGKSSKFDSLCEAGGGKGGKAGAANADANGQGGNGGSGGGSSGYGWEWQCSYGGAGGTNGNKGGQAGLPKTNYTKWMGTGGTGQGTTTRDFGESSGTMRAGGGGGRNGTQYCCQRGGYGNDSGGGAGGKGCWNDNTCEAPGKGKDNYGGGGGAGGEHAGAAGGKGIVIIRSHK